MNILFITMGTFYDLDLHGIYPDLMRCLRDHGHDVTILGAYPRALHKNEEVIEKQGVTFVHTVIGNIEKCSPIEKGMSMLFLQNQFIKTARKYLGKKKFELVMYATPPITLAGVIHYIKKHNNAQTYLMLKDIFPQNAVDVGFISKRGMIYKYFRWKEKKLYSISDTIGCMSEANVDYVLKNNPQEVKGKVEVCPNAIAVRDIETAADEKDKIRIAYGLPLETVVFVYGGNLGRPQGIPFVVECLGQMVHFPDVFFLIIGNGTEYHKLETFISKHRPRNVKLLPAIQRDEYNLLISACDVGLIFLDYRFTIPNFPSRLLAYMQAKLPVFAVTDKNTDIGKVIVEGGFGWWCESKNSEDFKSMVKVIVRVLSEPEMRGKVEEMKHREWEYLNKHYSVENIYEIIMRRVRAVETCCGNDIG